MRRAQSFFLAAVLASLALAAGAAPTPSKVGKPRTLLTAPGAIYAFAQDGDAVAWIGDDGRVRVRRLSTKKTSVVGTVSKERARTATLSLAGTRAVWSWDDGGNSTASPVVTGAPGHRQVRIADLGGGLRDMGDGHDLVGLAGDGMTLVYGWVAETCPGQPYGCEVFEGPLVVAGGGISVATWEPAPRPFEPPVLANVPPPALLAVSQGRVAVAAARVSTPIGTAPRVAEDGTVEVFDLGGRLQLRISLLGLVRDIALSGTKLAVLLEQPDGSKRIEEYGIPNTSFVRAARTPLAARDLAEGSRGTVFRAGRDIYVLKSGYARLAGRAAAQPIGLSIEGRRIAWAENIHGRGRVRVLTLPG